MSENVGSVNKTHPYHRENLRERLLDSACELLEQEGLEALSLRELARRAGVSPMAPYRHFEDKAALLDAVTIRGFSALREELARIDVAWPNDARRALVEQGMAYVHFASTRRHLFRLMFARPPLWQEGDHPDREGTAFHLFARRIRALVPEGDAEAALFAAHACVHGLASLVNDGRLRVEQRSPERIRAAIAYFVDRLAAR